MTDAQRIDAMRNKGKGAMEVGYRFDKPPLTYWWMRLYYNLLGINEFAARLHTVTATWLVSLVIFGMGSRLASPRAGLMGGIAWLTTLQVFIHGHLCVADMPMVLFVALACWATMEVFRVSGSDFQARASDKAAMAAASDHARHFTSWHWLLYISLGLGFLAKGPIAWLVPGLALMLMRFAFWRKPLPWRVLKLWPGLLLTLAITGAWGIPALIETQGLFWKVGMGEHVIERGASSFNGRFPIPGYYFVTMFVSLFPWIALLPHVWRNVRANWTPQTAFLVSWLAAPYLIFSFYATQLPHYVMPGFPAAMLLMITCWRQRPATRVERWTFNIVTVSAIALSLALVVIALRMHHYWDGRLPGTADSHLPYLCAALAVAAIALLCYVVMGCTITNEVLMHSSNPDAPAHPMPRLALVAKTCVVLICVLGSYVTCDALRVSQPAAQFAKQIGPLPAKTEYLGWQFQEPSLVFHFNHHWKFLSKLDSINARLDRSGPRVCVLLRREWTMSNQIDQRWHGKDTAMPSTDYSKEVAAVIAAHPDYAVIEFSGLNAARASWVELRVLVRRQSSDQP